MLEFHECAAVFPLMAEAELQELADDIKTNGLIEPIVLCSGEVLDGRNRYLACILAEVEPRYEPWRGDDALAYVVSKNLKRRHLNGSQRAVIANRLATIRPQDTLRRGVRSAKLPNGAITQPEAAEMLGVSERSVRTVAAVEREAPELIPLIESGDISANMATKIAANHYIRDVFRGGGITLVEAKQAISFPHISRATGESEWYTPKEYIDAARLVMGTIDLDPASTEAANTVVGAAIFYDAATDGLAQGWRGRVWMNPPYSTALVAPFAHKLVEHVRAGDVTEAIVLVNNATETAWFGKLVSVAAAVCFPHGRVKFWAPDKETSAPLQGQALIYIGQNVARFRDAYAEIGWSAVL